jgi:hypothetical protein
MLDNIACAIAPSAPTVGRTLVVVHGDVAQELDRIAAAEDAVLVALGPSRRRAFARSAAHRLIRRGQRAVTVCPDPEAVFAGTEPLSSGRGARVDLRPKGTAPRPTGRSRRA